LFIPFPFFCPFPLSFVVFLSFLCDLCIKRIIVLLMSLCPQDSTQELLDGFLWNFVLICHWGIL
jgi:hypothetical protein